jgi:death-on-curing protein
MRYLTLGEVVALHRAHAAMEGFLNLNGLQLIADIDEHERLMLDLAAGRSSRQALEDWLNEHVGKSDR